MNKENIKQILIEQSEEVKRLFRQKIIPRGIVSEAKGIFASDLIKVITGIRRCGKSVLSHYLLKDSRYGYVNFDDERLISVKAEDLNDFLEVLIEIDPDLKDILLDEVQNVEGWELFINRLKRDGYNLIVTGSNSRLLSKELSTHLTGRHFTIELYPFSFREFLLYNNFSFDKKDLYITKQKAKIKKMLKEYIENGGLPEVYKVEPKKQYLRELYDRIITRDIISRYNVKYAKDLKEIALFSISNFASKISYNKIKNIFEMKSVHTVKNYLHYLEEAYLLFQVNAFSHKLKEQIKLPKKIYCIDTGIINSIVPRSTLDYGKLLENLVFIELKRRGSEIYIYSKPNCEVDFVVKEGLAIRQLIQVSYSIKDEKTKKREIKALIEASRDLDCSRLTLITWDEEGEEEIESKKIYYIPAWKWLLEQ